MTYEDIIYNGKVYSLFSFAVLTGLTPLKVMSLMRDGATPQDIVEQNRHKKTCML
jgi:hypothetical protein